MDHQAIAQMLGNYGEFVGAIGVVVTLAYLAIQIRQNSRLLANAAKQATQSSIYAQNMLAVENDAVRQAITRGMLHPSDLNADERARWHYYWMTAFITYQEAFKEVKQTGADDDFWNVLEHGIRRQLQTPGLADWWRRNQAQFNSKFVDNFSDIVGTQQAE